LLVPDGAPREDPLGARHLPELNLKDYLTRHCVNATILSFAPKNDFGANVLGAARKASSDLI
jgi:hypothetical protein